MRINSDLITKTAFDLSIEKLTEKTNFKFTSANYAFCISKLRIFLTYRHPWVQHCPDVGGLTVLHCKTFCGM